LKVGSGASEKGHLSEVLGTIPGWIGSLGQTKNTFG
jgi:hypothetical protein